MNTFHLTPKSSVNSNFYSDNVSATLNYSICIQGITTYNPLEHYIGVPELGFKIILEISRNEMPLPRIIGIQLNELLLQGNLWQESQIQIALQPIQKGDIVEELKNQSVLNYNCKIMPSVDGMIVPHLGTPYGYIKSIRIQINFLAEKKSLNLNQYAKACNYLLSCLVIDQLQGLIPMAFKKQAYREAVLEMVKYIPTLYECLGHDNEAIRVGLWQTIQHFSGGASKTTCYKPGDIDGLVIASAVTNEFSMESDAASIPKEELSHAIYVESNGKQGFCDSNVSTQKASQQLEFEEFEELSVASASVHSAPGAIDEETFQMLV